MKKITKNILVEREKSINEELKAKGCIWEILIKFVGGYVAIDFTQSGSGIHRSAIPALLTNKEALFFLEGMGRALNLIDRPAPSIGDNQ